MQMGIIGVTPYRATTGGCSAGTPILAADEQVVLRGGSACTSGCSSYASPNSAPTSPARGKARQLDHAGVPAPVPGRARAPSRRAQADRRRGEQIAHLKTDKRRAAQAYLINGTRGRGTVSVRLGPRAYWTCTSGPIGDVPGRHAAVRAGARIRGAALERDPATAPGRRTARFATRAATAPATAGLQGERAYLVRVSLRRAESGHHHGVPTLTLRQWCVTMPLIGPTQ
jgi:hypothetical protein